MDQPATSFDGAWARFQALESFRLFPDTLEGEFASERAEYLAFLVSVQDQAARAHLTRTVQRLDGIPGVEPYSESYWHVTIKGVGFRVPVPSAPDELSHRAATAIAEAARPVLSSAPAFDARLGRVNGFDGVVFVEVLDGGRLAAINAALVSAVPELSHHPHDAPNYLPHVSIARFTSNEGLDALKSTLAAVRDEIPVGPPLPVRRIDLIAARLSAEIPAFENLASYPLRMP